MVGVLYALAWYCGPNLE